MLVHGLGDHIGRYDEIGSMLASRGLHAVGVDFPGHGISPGIRGHIGGWDAVRTIFEESIAHLRTEVGERAPLGMMAHSMGAFVGLYFMQHAPEVFQFAWLSSPLVKPGSHRGPGTRALARFAAWFVPWATLDSGVRPADCRPIRGDEDLDPLCHHRVSVAWGATCLGIEERLYEGLGSLDAGLNLLITHGDADVVCPPEYSREVFDAIELEKKEYRLFKDLMHEPFRGEDRRIEVLAAAGDWLERMGFSEVRVEN